MINPLLMLDYPDLDVIRVEDTYYMISTTMYFMPGGEILRSKDLVNWEHACFIYDTLDGTPAQRLEDGKGVYGAGMWAASLRYHEGKFYVMFVCNDTKKTYLYVADSIDGPWVKSHVEGFYHDCSLLFDDGRVYVVYGNREIHLTELNSELTGPKEGGLDRVIVRDTDTVGLGYEGSHLYKINNRYYVFFIHSVENRWFRVESCFVADSLEGDFVGGDIFANDIGYCDSGVAQGGIVDTPDGKWYGIFFQDRGAVGRIPVLVPVEWENNPQMGGLYPKITGDADTLLNPVKESDLSPYICEPLWGSDDFDKDNGPSFGFASYWQFNHEPVLQNVHIDTANKCFELTTDRITNHIHSAVNTLTQRLKAPCNHIEVTVDASGINNGDYAGLTCLQDAYGFVAITKDNDEYYMVMNERVYEGEDSPKYEDIERARVKIDSPVQVLSFDANFDNMVDEVIFNIGPAHKMYFKITHFTGNRAGLFYYSTKESGGKVKFSKFKSVDKID